MINTDAGDADPFSGGGTVASRIQKKKEAPDTKEVEVEEEPSDVADREAHLADIDAMLDEIDEVLETNAEEFVKGYIQKGGQ